MGAAVAGGVGVGLWPDFSQVDRMVGVAAESRPRRELEPFYAELYAIFEQTYAALEGADVFRRLEAVERSGAAPAAGSEPVGPGEAS